MTSDFSLGTAVDARDAYRERGRLLEERQEALEQLGEAVAGVGSEWLNGFAVVLEKVVKSAGTEDFAEIQGLLMEARSAIYEYDQFRSKRTFGQGLRKVEGLREVSQALREWELTE